MKFSKSGLILALILIINYLLRAPGLFEPVSYGDECIYLTLGQAFNKGLVYYRDIHDNKPPLLYLTAAFTQGKLFWFRFFSYLWNGFNVLLIYKLVLKMYRSTKPALFAAALFAWLSLLFEGRTANGELFMIMPATAAVLIMYILHNKKPLRLHKLHLKPPLAWFFSGFLFALAFLYKIPIAFDFIGILFAFFFFSQKTLRQNLNSLKNINLYLLIAGFIFPIILSVVYYAGKDAFTPYVRSALMQNIGYLSSWGEGSQEQSFLAKNQGLVIRGLLILSLTLILYLFKNNLKFNFILASLWFVWGLFGSMLSERPYPHYLLELAPSLSLLITITLASFNITKTAFALLFLWLLNYYYHKYDFWWYAHLPYYQNFYQYITGAIDQQTYNSYFGDKNLNDYQIAQYINTHTDPADRIFLWGEGSCIYALTDRLPPGRYTVNYHIYDFNGFQETMDAIKKTQPKIIVKLRDDQRQYQPLNIYIDQNYSMVQDFDGSQIFKKS